MKSPFGWFRRWHSKLGLGWKLTFSYTLVTVGALFVVLLLFFVLWFAGLSSGARYAAEELIDHDRAESPGSLDPGAFQTPSMRETSSVAIIFSIPGKKPHP